LGVEIHLHTAVKKVVGKDKFEYIELQNGQKVIGDACIIATGGFSYQTTGSNGDGYRFAKELGHEVTDIRPALVPLVIKEDYVLGIYDTSRSGEVLSVMLNFMTTSLGFYLVILFPVILVGVLWLGEVLRNLYYAKLECDVVEQKRKITDEICRKAQIGYRMSNKTKLKVLAQASLEEKQEYINLLWKGGKAPNKIKKYYIEKRILLKPIQQLLEVNQKCEQMFSNKVSHEEIARYYIKEKNEITKQEARIQKQIKTIRAKYQREKEGAKN
jgi:hypothetical protein